MKRIQTLGILLWLVSCTCVYAVVATPEPLIVKQTDGTELELFLVGDEYGHYYATADGKRMKRNRAGAFVEEYNVRKASSLQRKPDAIHASFPLTGKVRSLAILVNFTDVKFSVPNPQQQYTRLLNESGYSDNGGTGSARDYFIASSDSAFLPDFDVYGPYDLSHEMAYYGGNDDQNARQMIVEAVALADAAGVDMSLYDENNDGVIDNVFVYYAGHNEAEHGPDDSVWPHRSVVLNSGVYSGKTIYDYACTSELKGYDGVNMCGIGTFCHEFGHVLGLADLYKTTDNQSGESTYTVGNWDIMCSGNYNNEGRTPPTYTAFERFYLGWLKPQQLLESANCWLEPIATSNTAYLIASGQHNLSGQSPIPNEYFLIENRQRVGWDAGKDALPGVGLLISHVNFNAASWKQNTFNNGTPLGYDIVEAYNPNPNTSSPADTYPGTGGVTNWIPTLYDGTLLNDMPVLNIEQLADLSMSFRFGAEAGTGFGFAPGQMEVFTTTYDRQPIEYDTQELTITGVGIKTDSVTLSLSNSLFQMCIDGKWSNSLTFNDAVADDSTYMRTIQLRHSPRRQNCGNTTATLRIESFDHLQINQIVLTGTAPRPIYIDTPVAKEASDLTPYSFIANWEEDKDAELYYFTLYTLKDEPSDVLQGFENFDTQENIVTQGWSANFLGVTTSEFVEGQRGLLFRSTENQVVSEIYQQPVTKLSFWLSNTYLATSDAETGGTLLVEAQNEKEEWVRVDSIKVLRTTKKVVKTYEFVEADAYVRFRLTYLHLGGNGGTVVDNFIVHMNKTVEYIYKQDEYILYAPVAEVPLTGLTPQTDYYYQLQAYEEKGCEPHLTSLSVPIKATTLWGVEDERQFTIQYKDESTVVAYLPSMASSGSRLLVYSVDGKLVEQVVIAESTYMVDIYVNDLTKGNLYLVKYVPNEKIKRKDLWAKFIY